MMIFYMKMAARSSLSSEYLNTPRMQWISAAEELSQHLREQPLLPSKFKQRDQTFTDMDSGICLPKWHCVFAGCLACAEESTSKEIVQEEGIWQDIWKDKKHLSILIKLIQKYNLQQHFQNQEYVAFSLLSEAIAVSERQHSPLVGASLDRRALQCVGAVFNKDHISVLI